jgi:hypothetical protein
MSSVAIVTVANARHVRSAEMTSAETSHATSAEPAHVAAAEAAHVAAAEAAHMTAATATHVTTAAATSVSASASATACLRTRRQQRRCKHGGCQYLHRSSYHNIFLSTHRAISDR